MKRKYKWAFAFILTLIFLAFGFLMNGEPLINRAMVVGFGIDSDGDKLSISAQVLQPGGGNESPSMNSRVVTAENTTIAGAMSSISEKAGLTVALTHCNVVILGREIAESSNVYSVISYLISNNYLSENAFLYVADDKAKDLFNSNTGFGGNASLYIQKLVGKYGEYEDVGARTLQDFVVDYHRKGRANWLPIIKTEKAEPEITENPSPSTEDDFIFTFNTFMAFEKNVKVGEYGKEDMTALNFLKYKVKKGALTADGDNGERILIYIIDKKDKIKYDLEEKKVAVELKFSAILKEIIDYGSEDRFVDRTVMTDTEHDRAEEKVKNQVTEFFYKMREINLDILGLYEGFYSKYGNKAENLALKDITLDVKVDIEIRDI